MERQDYRIDAIPASKMPRVKSFLQSRTEQHWPSDEVRALAREVLAMNQHMREQDMPYVLQLHNAEYGPDILVMDKKTGLPCRKLAHDLINDLVSDLAALHR